MNDDIVIRRAQFEDADQCAKILRDGWKRAFPRERRPVTLAIFLAETAGETVLVAERKRKVAGFASVHVEDCFLHHLYVRPRLHRRGLGSALLAAARALTPGPITLKTQEANARARAFYTAHGYSAVEYGDDGQGRWVRLQSPR